MIEARFKNTKKHVGGGNPRRLIDKIPSMSANNTIVWFDPERWKKRRQEQRAIPFSSLKKLLQTTCTLRAFLPVVLKQF